MKKALLVVLIVTLVIVVVSCPLLLAGTCSYRGYGSYGYSPSYGHGYSSYTNYGYSSYYPNSYYWSGGYYSGGYGYSPGYYAPGYYDQYGKGYTSSYSPCQYHYPTAAYFPKYESAFIVLKTPSYGIYAEQPLAERSVVNTGTVGYNGGGGYTFNPAATPSGYAAGGNIIEGKLDKILVAVTTVSQDVAELKAWRVQVDRDRGVTPVPSRNPTLPGKNTKPPANIPPTDNPESEQPTEADKAVNILHTSCVRCHHENTVVKERAKVILFVKGEKSDEMATRATADLPDGTKKGQITSLSPQLVKKVQEQLTEKTMPPEKDAAGNAVTKMSDVDRQKASQFLAQILAQINRPAGPAVRE